MSDLAQAREAKILEARTLANWQIGAEFPRYKEVNQVRIDAIRAQCESYETAAAGASDQQALAAIVISYEAQQ